MKPIRQQFPNPAIALSFGEFEGFKSNFSPPLVQREKEAGGCDRGVVEINILFRSSFFPPLLSKNKIQTRGSRLFCELNARSDNLRPVLGAVNRNHDLYSCFGCDFCPGDPLQ